MTQPSDTRRLACPACLRPQRTCICHWIAPIGNAVEVLILQHPLEVDNAKGSARLLHLSLRRSRLVVGEAFAEQELHDLLYARRDHPRRAIDQPEPAAAHPILLYPDAPGSAAGKLPSLVPEQTVAGAAAHLRLVILDGTWRKSRKMLFANPLLQALPRLPLRDAPPSHYLIRKAHRPDQFSTLEAACYALMQLEQRNDSYARLLASFDGFVAQQLGYRALGAQ